MHIKYAADEVEVFSVSINRFYFVVPMRGCKAQDFIKATCDVFLSVLDIGKCVFAQKVEISIARLLTRLRASASKTLIGLSLVDGVTIFPDAEYLPFLVQRCP